MSMEIYLTNLGKYVEGCLMGQWVKLPVPEDKLADVLVRIGVNEEYEEFFITDYETSFHGLRDVLGEYESIDMLNELAEMLDELSEEDEDKLNAIMECRNFKNIFDIVEQIQNLDNFDLLPDVDDDTALGYYYVDELGCFEIPDNIRNYFDYEAFGRDIRLESDITYTSFGCLICND